MPFMMEIDASRRAPLDQLAVDFSHVLRSGQFSIDFCRRVCGVPESDEVVGRRLGVPVAMVRGWREVGRRAGSGIGAAR
jgi:DNA-binding transcriptional regulator YiaG